MMWSIPRNFQYNKATHSTLSLVRVLQCKKNQTPLHTNWYLGNFLFGIERYQNRLRAILNLLVGPSQKKIMYWWRHKQNKNLFHQNTKSNYTNQMICYYWTRKLLQPYNNVQYQKKYGPLKIRLWRIIYHNPIDLVYLGVRV